MSVELVTGYSGVGSSGEPNRHVSSAEDGARQAGTLGLGCYVLSTGSKLSATMEDANTLVVADGDAVMNGRHVRLTETTSFTIPTGVQGKKVSNLAVLRYQKTADSVESVTPVVLTGEPSTGTPTDPEYNDGSVLDGASIVDMPLYRVVTNGTNYETPVLLPRVVKPMADLWNSVSQKLDASRVHVGSKVVELTMPSGGGWEAKDNFLTKEELRSMLGRTFNSATDCVVVWNGDWETAHIIPMPFARTSTDGSNVGVYVTSPVTWDGSGRKSLARIGYMVVEGS